MQAEPAVNFSCAVDIGEASYEFQVRKHPSAHDRYFIETATMDGEMISFVLVRTSIRQWAISGHNLPPSFSENTQVIGKLIEGKA
jgi:hypothetical protein